MCITRRVAPLIRSYRHESNSVQRKKLTPPQVAKMLGVNCDKVLGWIRRGELRAVNVAANPNGRPRYRIDADDLRAFENQRSLTPKSPTRTRRQRKKQNVIKYF
ncbi:MAG: DNA-binding protein [Planctomycetaceae bacterium]|nr:DNA-binding protein [Planctomycetaceae bacterium]